MSRFLLVLAVLFLLSLIADMLGFTEVQAAEPQPVAVCDDACICANLYRWEGAANDPQIISYCVDRAGL